VWLYSNRYGNPANFGGGMWVFADAQKPGLTWGVCTPANVCEHGSFDWGSSGRRFKSCQPDQRTRR
jgi:hypothetical protein